MQSIIRGQAVPSLADVQGSTSLKPGQILFGQVNKIFPNQMAEVQIGRQKMIAHLDVPLQAGQRYWLQVQPSEGSTVLKVLDSPKSDRGGNNPAAALLNYIGIQEDSDSLKLANYFLKNQLPITKEAFSSALQWIKSSGEDQDLSIIKKMFTLQLPFTQKVFDALSAQEKGTPMHELLSGLQKHLESAGNETGTVISLKELLAKLNTRQAVQDVDVQSLVRNWLDSKAAPEQRAAAFSLLQKVGFMPSGMHESELLGHLLTEASQRLPQNDRLKQGLSLIVQTAAETATELKELDAKLDRIIQGKQTADAPAQEASNESRLPARLLGQLLSKLPAEWTASNKNKGDLVGNAGQEAETANVPQNSSPKDHNQHAEKILIKEAVSNQTMSFLERYIGKGSSAQDPLSNHKMEKVLALMNPVPGQSAKSTEQLKEMVRQLQMPSSGPLPVSEHERALLAVAAGNAEAEPFSYGDGARTAHHFKEMIKLLGLGFEHSLAHPSKNAGGDEEILDALKPLLLKLISEHHSDDVRMLAEQIVNRLTAQQLLSHDNGPVQNLLLTIPLNLGHLQTDLTMQWSGKKDEDGQIDPNYCRVLFYLELGSLKETIMDMQIQNRVITVKIINENSERAEAAAAPFLAFLKDNLKNMNYHLSGVLFQNPGQSSVKETIPLSQKGSYNGVDFKI